MWSGQASWYGRNLTQKGRTHGSPPTPSMSGLVKKVLLQEDFASDSESPVGRVSEQAFVQPMREEGTVVHNGGDIKIY